MAKLNGDSREFEINPDIKLYALTDAGFTKGKSYYHLVHPLYMESPYKPMCELKIDISTDLKKLTMLITDLSGLKKVDIFKKDEFKPVRELLDFILNDLKERNIIAEKK